MIEHRAMAGSKIYNCWNRMKRRCLNPKNKDFKHYGGRGITVCEEWKDFQKFYEYVSQLPHFGEKGYSIDRIDVNGNYEPGNVRWADKYTQSRNRRNINLIEFDGELVTLTEISKRTGISLQTLYSRFQAGDRGEKLVRPNIGHAKINKTDAQKIRALYATGKYLEKDIAAMYEIQQVTVSAIITNKTWKNQENKVEK